VEQYDDNEKPLKLRELDYGVKEFVNPLSLYQNQKNWEDYRHCPGGVWYGGANKYGFSRPRS